MTESRPKREGKPGSEPETLEEFKNSISYGSRTDLLFKFLANLTDQEAAEFLRVLLELLGDAFDADDFEGVAQHVYRSQAYAYAPKEGTQPLFQYDSAPWTRLSRPLSECRVALISSGGLFVAGDDPLGPNAPTQEQAIDSISSFLRNPPVLSIIPRDIDPMKVTVRHPGYDIRAAVRDFNVVFPIDRLKELQTEGVFGELSEVNYSFVGATSQKRLLKEAAPEWAKMLTNDRLDAALLVGA